MDTVLQRDFAFFEALPKAKKSRASEAMEQLSEIRMMIASGGALLPVSFVVKLTGVSRQRIHALCDDGRLVCKEVEGHRLVTENSVLEWCRSERKTGRPPKAMSAGDVWQASKTEVKEALVKKR